MLPRKKIIIIVIPQEKKTRKLFPVHDGKSVRKLCSCYEYYDGGKLLKKWNKFARVFQMRQRKVKLQKLFVYLRIPTTIIIISKNNK